MFCDQCGKENPDDGKYCIHCGHPLTEDDNKGTQIETIPQNHEKKKKHIGLIILIIILVLIAVIFGSCTACLSCFADVVGTGDSSSTSNQAVEKKEEKVEEAKVTEDKAAEEKKETDETQKTSETKPTVKVGHEKTPSTYVCNHRDYTLYVNVEWTSEVDFHLTGWIEDLNGNAVSGSDVEDDLTCVNLEAEDELGFFKGDHSSFEYAYGGGEYYTIIYIDTPYSGYDFSGVFYQGMAQNQTSSNANTQPQDIPLITDEETFASFLRDQPNNVGKTIRFYAWVLSVSEAYEPQEFNGKSYSHIYCVLFSNEDKKGWNSTKYSAYIYSTESLPLIANDLGLFTATYQGQQSIIGTTFSCENAEFVTTSE